MPRSRKSGLNVVRKRRKDGTVIEYFYDIQTREFLGHDRTKAEARVRAKDGGSRPDTIASLIARYKASDSFLSRKPRTQELYSHYLAQIERGWGDLPASAIRPSTIVEIKDHLRDEPSKCNMVLALFRILLGLAVRLEYVPENVAAKPGRIAAPPRKVIWTREEEQRFLDAARPSLRLAFALLLYTLQRPSDVLEMTVDRVSARDGRLFIALQQAKTGALIDVPVHTTLEPLLRQRLAGAEPGALLVASPRGHRWSRRNFSRAWDKARVAAGLDGLQRRDLRRTGIVRMAEAGCPTPTIAAVSGHAIDACQRIIDTYLPRRTEVAVTGIELWEQAGVRDNSAVVQLAARRKMRPRIIQT